MAVVFDRLADFLPHRIDPTSTTASKKAKKSALATSTVSENDERLLQRARRFEREHEIERQKQAGLHPTHEHSRHVNHAAVGALEGRMEGLTTFSSSASRGTKGQSRRKYLNSVGTEDPSADQAVSPRASRYLWCSLTRWYCRTFLIGIGSP